MFMNECYYDQFVFSYTRLLEVDVDWLLPMETLLLNPANFTSVWISLRPYIYMQHKYEHKYIVIVDPYTYFSHS